MICQQCGRELSRDEIGLSCKLISRDRKTCLCLDCLGNRFRVSREQLTDMIEHFRRAGCTMFGGAG